MHCTEEYVERRKLLVEEHVAQLLITVGKPHKPATSNTVARWVKQELTVAGIDTSIYKAQSCRSASCSKAKDIGIPHTEILILGGLSGDSTFKRFYDKSITGKNDKKSLIL